MKKVLILALMGAMAAAAFAAETQPAAPAQPTPAAQAQPIAPASNGGEMVTTIDASYVTKYIWRGFDVLDDKAAFQPSVNLDLGNGWNFNVWSSFAGASKNGGSVSTVDATEMDYSIAYKNSFGENCFLTNYTVGWRYYDWIKIDSERGDNSNSSLQDMQEGFVELAMPNLIGNGFVPRYAYYHMWQAVGDSGHTFGQGPIHDLGLDYNWTFEQMPELPMKASADAVFNDGTGYSTDDNGVDSDWSHILWGLSTNFKCPMTGAKVTPGIFYQTSMDDSVNKNDEFFSGISYALSF